jgi:hypothetical protein
VSENPLTPEQVSGFASGPSYDTWISSYSFGFSFFNPRLFDGEVPYPLFTYTHLKCAVQFRPDFFVDKDGRRAHGLAFNAKLLKTMTDEEKLSVLVHGMALMKRHMTEPRWTVGYCDAVLARILIDVGLVPTTRGSSKTDGLGHKIDLDGPFAVACRELLATGFTIKYIAHDGLTNISLAEVERRKQKNGSKTKFTCPSCHQNAWAKITARLKCGSDDIPLVVADD